MNEVKEKKHQMEAFLRIVKGIGISILLSLIFLIIYSIILTYTSVNDTTIPVVIIIINVISILIGSSICTLKLNKNGIINGMMIGGFYMLILYLLSSMIHINFSFTLYSTCFIVLGIIAGSIRRDYRSEFKIIRFLRSDKFNYFL